MKNYTEMPIDTNYNVRIPLELRDDFKQICKNNLLNPSAVMRDFMIKFIKEHENK